ncbi:transporter substrate-binding domain-containing protein [Psychrobacter sp. I-STPA10]|uniref:transporter substrate-binding domain-containing protein n=1 Tax=Psychrobacter sp. I-STPA10 TaxID=2585769 RepID=UPI001E291218|nr:transporter substrate-binding domain-containing protein [Psychrobacter sp. I-STPA10]
MSSIRYIPTVTSFVSILVFTLTACSNASNSASKQNNTTEQKSNQNNTTNSELTIPEYIVSTDKHYKPFEFRDDEGKITGFDIDIVNAIAADQNFHVAYIMTPFEDQLTGLKKGKYDMVAAGISITEERKQTIDFSDTYFTSTQGIIALPSTPPISDFDMLKTHKVAVEANTTSDDILANQLKMDHKNIIHVASPYKGIEAVIQKKVMYSMADEPVLRYYNKELKNFDLQISTIPNAIPEDYGFAFDKNRKDDLINKVNTGLENIKANGTYQQIYDKWF